jgi:hypothetical protein
LKFKRLLTLSLVAAFTIGSVKVFADTDNNGTGGGQAGNISNVGGFQNDSDVGYRVSIIKPTGELVAIRDIVWSDPEQDLNNRTYLILRAFKYENKLGQGDEGSKNNFFPVPIDLIAKGIPKPFAWDSGSSSFVGLGEDLKQWLVVGKAYYGDNSLGGNSGVVNNASGSTTSNTGGSTKTNSQIESMTENQLKAYIISNEGAAALIKTNTGLI